MPIGDDAVAAGMDLTLGSVAANTIDDEINKTRDYVAQERSARITADNGKVDKPSDGGLMARREPGSVHNIGFYTDVTSTLYFRPDATSALYDRKVITQQEFDLLLARVHALDGL